MFFPPILLIRKKMIIKKLREHGAISENTAVTLKEAGVINPHAFSKLTEKLERDNILIKTKDQTYYLNKHSY